VRVLLDANALMMPVQFGVDVLEEIRWLIGSYEPVTLVDVQHELEGLAQGRGEDAAAARVGLSLTSRCTIIRDVPSVGTVDERIAEYAEKENCIVATNDRGLRRRLLRMGIDVITLRKKKTLEIERA
jgi:rRNA-processing protein FCF1